MKQWILAVTGDIGAGKTSAIQQMTRPIGEAEVYRIPVGQLMRDKEAAGVIEEMEGELAPEGVMRSTVEEKIDKIAIPLKNRDKSFVIVIDGVPRFPGQLEWIEEVAERLGVGLAVAFLSADLDALDSRLRDRRRADHVYDRQRWDNTHEPVEQCLPIVLSHHLPHYCLDTTGSLPQINGMWLSMFALWLLEGHEDENSGAFE